MQKLLDFLDGGENLLLDGPDIMTGLTAAVGEAGEPEAKRARVGGEVVAWHSLTPA